MSRLEAYQDGLRDGNIIRVDEWFLPHFMDVEKDAIEVRVRANGLLDPSSLNPVPNSVLAARSSTISGCHFDRGEEIGYTFEELALVRS